MVVNEIKIQNFRGFEDFSTSLNKEMTVIVGDNGAGKSSLLDALSIAIGTLLSGFDSVPAPMISKDDALLKSYDMGSVIDLQPQFPVTISAKGEIEGRPISWERSLEGANGRTKITGAKDLVAIAKDYQKRIRQGDRTLILPLISYYGTGRLWAQKREKRSNMELERFPRQEGYTDCLTAESNEKLMLKWFEKMSIQQVQNSRVSPEFDAVKKAIAACVKAVIGSESIDVQFNLDTHGIDVVFDKNGERKRLPMKDLSDGYKNTLSMIGDIAYRMAVLNPQLLGDVLEKTPGVVLIDEVDLHLHPIWQQRILQDLRSIFPRIQFIVSTHAPSVINSVTSDHLLVLDESRDAYMPAVEVYGSDSNTVLVSVMGANDRPVAIKSLFERFYHLLDEKSFEEADKLLDQIEEKIGQNDSELHSARTALFLDRA